VYSDRKIPDSLTYVWNTTDTHRNSTKSVSILRNKKHERFEVIRAVGMMMMIFSWVLEPCELIDWCQRYGGI
jgi:hypothetical protein